MKFENVPGPWEWVINESSKSVALRGVKDGSWHLVMDFVRYGFNSAQPRFEFNGLMHKATEYASVIKEREHHASWHKTISGNPNALLILAAPLLCKTLLILHNDRLQAVERGSGTLTHGEAIQLIEAVLEKAGGKK